MIVFFPFSPGTWPVCRARRACSASSAGSPASAGGATASRGRRTGCRRSNQQRNRRRRRQRSKWCWWSCGGDRVFTTSPSKTFWQAKTNDNAAHAADTLASIVFNYGGKMNYQMKKKKRRPFLSVSKLPCLVPPLAVVDDDPPPPPHGLGMGAAVSPEEPCCPPLLLPERAWNGLEPNCSWAAFSIGSWKKKTRRVISRLID